MSDDKIALVTGGNRGIGLGIVEGLLRDGFQVIMGSRSLEFGRLAISYLEDLAEHVDLMQLDVTDPVNVRKATKYITKNYDHIDVLVNNAGIIGNDKDKIKGGKIKEVQIIMNTNFYGPMRMIASLMPLMEKSKNARIINVSSRMGSLDNLFADHGAYRMSKAALNAQTILLSNELKESKIKVFAMCPGWVRTDMGGPDAHRSVEEGADTAIFLATDNTAESGKFYMDREVIPW